MFIGNDKRPESQRHPVGNISNALMTAKRLLGERIATYSAKGLNYKDRLLEDF